MTPKLLTGVVSARVTGKAKEYSYWQAKLYKLIKSKVDEHYFYIPMVEVRARRSKNKAIEDAIELAKMYNTEYDSKVKYGYNPNVTISKT